MTCTCGALDRACFLCGREAAYVVRAVKGTAHYAVCYQHAVRLRARPGYHDGKRWTFEPVEAGA